MTAPPGAITGRERLGKLVRDTWIAWVRECRPDISSRSSWLTPWETLDDGQREVDMRIGEAVAAAERERLQPLFAAGEACATYIEGQWNAVAMQHRPSAKWREALHLIAAKGNDAS